MTLSAALSIRVQVNGRAVSAVVPARVSLAEFLRDELGLSGTNVGCEQGVCGACTVLVDGRPARSCLLLAAQADGASVVTVEGLAPSPTELSPLQEAFRDAHGLQCGYCTPGMLIMATALLGIDPDPDEDLIRDYMHGNLCRCTGYQQIVEAVRLAAGRRTEV